MLFQPEAHERPTDEAWAVERVRAAIHAIVADAEDAFNDGWPAHPEDEAAHDRRLHAIYLGGAGVVEALRRLQELGVADVHRDYLPYLEQALEAEPDFPDQDSEQSLWMGETGIRLVLQRLSPSADNLTRLSELIDANAHDERRELMWGSPGTMLAARELGLDRLWQASADWLLDEQDADGLWTQDLYGSRRRLLGPAHGFAGCVLALGVCDGVADTARQFAVQEGGLANWPPIAGGGLTGADGSIRTQWCHGAPGIVASLAKLMDEDLALAGGELTWRAGPLAKGANLCHGTAGNGYAFLALLARTGDELWLARARAFAMHAIEQVERARLKYGHGRYTLWTGDIGTALYLTDCLRGAGGLPLP